MAGGRRRILVIEDDRETAQQLVDSLATSGYRVDLAVDGDDGLRRARCGEYAVMTIDRMLPGIDESRSSGGCGKKRSSPPP